MNTPSRTNDDDGSCLSPDNKEQDIVASSEPGTSGISAPSTHTEAKLPLSSDHSLLDDVATRLPKTSGLPRPATPTDTKLSKFSGHGMRANISTPLSETSGISTPSKHTENKLPLKSDHVAVLLPGTKEISSSTTATIEDDSLGSRVSIYVIFLRWSFVSYTLYFTGSAFFRFSVFILHTFEMKAHMQT